MRKTTPLLLLAALLGLTGTVAARFGYPEPLTERGRIMEDIYYQIAVAAIIVFVIVMALLAWVIYRYREGSGVGRATYEKHRHNTKAEVFWTVVPLMIMLWIGVISYVGLRELDQGVLPADADIEVNIVGSQWNWEAIYPSGYSMFSDPDSSTGAVAASSEFIVPAGKDILLNVTSIDVIHAFHIMDANRASVGLVDANPSGDHKYNMMVINLEEGEYFVQCREMCFNPGHAYMRAKFNAVPQAEYDLWMEQKTATIGAKIVEELLLEVNADGFTVSDPMTGVTGTRYVMTITNTAPHGVRLNVPGIVNPPSIASGATKVIAFDAATAGDYTLSASDDQGEQLTNGKIEFTALDAEVIDVDMGAFVFEPESLDFTEGETYLINVHNVHNTAHNLFIGTKLTGEILASSPSVNGGDSASFVFTPTVSAELDIWCNVPGHYEQGMFGEAHVHA